MKAAVRYFTRGGNTKKVAEAIAQAVGVPAETTANALTEDMDILFLGSSPYGFGLDEEVKAFIRGIDVKVGKVVNFSTAAAIKSTYNYVKEILAEKNIPLAQEEFACRGSFLMMHRGRPNESDLQAVKEFAKRIVEA